MDTEQFDHRHTMDHVKRPKPSDDDDDESKHQSATRKGKTRCWDKARQAQVKSTNEAVSNRLIYIIISTVDSPLSTAVLPIVLAPLSSPSN